MEVLESKSLDHLGLVAGVISDLEVDKLINQRLGQDSDKKITDGQAVSAMILNSLGFTSRPLSLTPQFFSNKALDVLFGESIQADDFNRHRLGRCLDAIYAYGCDNLFSEVAQSICQEEKINQTFLSLDTTSFKVSGNYEVESDEHEITLSHGYSKDHRPDLKQVVLELLVSQDGGIPLVSKSFSGNESDSKIFTERCKQLIEQMKRSEGPSYVIADSKLYCKSNSGYLNGLIFITRIPRQLKEEQHVVREALAESVWEKLDEENEFVSHATEHYGMQQRWFIIKSNAAKRRAEKASEGLIKKEKEKYRVVLKHLKCEEFDCKEDAERSINRTLKELKFHTIKQYEIKEKAHYRGKGRPKKTEEATRISYEVVASLEVDEEKIKLYVDERSCYVIGTNAKEELLSSSRVIDAYKNQNASIERGFRFLKDPYFFASSFFVKKPSRIMALLTVMTLSLLIYSVAQRRVRKQLKEEEETLPNQINQATQTPTLRWLFQVLEGVHVVYTKVSGKIQRVFTGIDAIKKKIILLFSEKTQAIYGFIKNEESGNEECSM